MAETLPSTFRKDCLIAFSLINHNSDEVSEAMFISDEFTSNLPKTIGLALFTNDTTTLAIDAVIQKTQPETPYELFFIGFAFAQIMSGISNFQKSC